MLARMENHIEVSPSGRASCKTCAKAIGKGELRLGESVPSQFGSDGMSLRWHHLSCAARALPAALQQALASFSGEVPERPALEAALQAGTALPPPKQATGALPSADLAPTGRAKCIHCNEAIAKASIRIAVEREVDTGSFVTKGAGYLHPACCAAWAVSGWEAGLDDLIAQVHSNTGLSELPPPFTAGTAAAAGGTGAAPTPAPKPPVEPPPFGSLSGKELAAMAAKFAKLKDAYKADSIIEKAGVEWGSRDPLRWHIAQHGLLEPTHPTLLHRLGDSAESAEAQAVFAVLPKLAKPTRETTDMFPGWSLSADSIVLRAHKLDAARLEALLTDAGAHLRTGIQLVRGRCGAVLPEEERQRVLTALAAGEAHSYGLPRSYSKDGARLYVKTLNERGELTEPYRDAADLARHFGSAAQWAQALAAQARAAKFNSLERVFAGLVILPLPELVTLLAKPHFSSGEEHDRLVGKLVQERNDDPLALFDAALKIAREASPGSYIREQLLIHALARLGERGQPIPPGLESGPTWESFQYCVPPWRGSAPLRLVYRQAITAIPRQRVLALINSIIEEPYGQMRALNLLSVQFDEALLQKLLKVCLDYCLMDASAFGALGKDAIPTLLALLAEPGEGADYKKRLAALGQCLRAALGFIGATGGGFEPSLDGWLSCLPQESYWSEEARAVFLNILKAMPEERRIAALTRVLAETPQIERAFLGVQTIADEGFRERAAHILVSKFGQVQETNTLQQGLRALGEKGLSYFPAALRKEKPDTKIFGELRNAFGYDPVESLMKELNTVEEKPLARLFRLAGEYAGPKERIYLLQRRDLNEEVPEARAGSFSFSRGAGPVVPEASKADDKKEAAPSKRRKGRSKGDAEHILTLDLEEIPELKPRFPDARAISLFAPDPEHGDGWDAAELRAIPAGATAPAGKNPLTVMPIEVPTAIFESRACQDQPTLKEIRGLVFNQPGYVLGEPMYIQDDEGGFDFVMQLAEQIGGLNLGDSGSLYVFEHGSFMQCY